MRISRFFVIQLCFMLGNQLMAMENQEIIEKRLDFTSAQDWTPDLVTRYRDGSVNRVPLVGNPFEFHEPSAQLSTTATAPTLDIHDANSCQTFYTRMQQWVSQCTLQPMKYIFRRQLDSRRLKEPYTHGWGPFSYPITLTSITTDYDITQGTFYIHGINVQLTPHPETQLNILSRFAANQYRHQMTATNQTYPTEDQVIVQNGTGVFGSGITSHTYTIPVLAQTQSLRVNQAAAAAGRGISMQPTLFRQAKATIIKRQVNPLEDDFEAEDDQGVDDVSLISDSVSRVSVAIPEANGNEPAVISDHQTFKLIGAPRAVNSPYLYSNGQQMLLTETFSQNCYPVNFHTTPLPTLTTATMPPQVIPFILEYTVTTTHPVAIESRDQRLISRPRSDGPFFEYRDHAWQPRNQNAVLPVGLYQFDITTKSLGPVDALFQPIEHVPPFALQGLITTQRGIDTIESWQRIDPTTRELYQRAQPLHGFVLPITAATGPATLQLPSILSDIGDRLSSLDQSIQQTNTLLNSNNNVSLQNTNALTALLQSKGINLTAQQDAAQLQNQIHSRAVSTPTVSVNYSASIQLDEGDWWICCGCNNLNSWSMSNCNKCNRFYTEAKFKVFGIIPTTYTGGIQHFIPIIKSGTTAKACDQNHHQCQCAQWAEILTNYQKTLQEKEIYRIAYEQQKDLLEQLQSLKNRLNGN